MMKRASDVPKASRRPVIRIVPRDAILAVAAVEWLVRHVETLVMPAERPRLCRVRPRRPVRGAVRA